LTYSFPAPGLAPRFYKSDSGGEGRRLGSVFLALTRRGLGWQEFSPCREEHRMGESKTAVFWQDLARNWRYTETVEEKR